MREKERFHQIDIKSFYVRRILRIWPLYFTFLAIAFVYFLTHPAYGVHLIYFATFAAFVGNLACAWWGAPILVITVLWSVSIEEQFYLAWPLLAARLSRRGVAIAGVILLIFCAAVRWELTRRSLAFHVIEYSTFTRLDPIAGGLLMSAILGGSIPLWLARWRIPLCASGIYLWLVASLCLSGVPSATNVMLAYPAVAVGASAFMLSALGAITWMRNPWLIYLGRISYGLYVYHAAALFLIVPILTPQRWLLCIVVSLAATIVVAAASYRWLESPFLRLKTRYQHVRSAAPVV